MKSDLTELQDIIEKANIPIDQKKMLSEIFNALSARNDSVLEEIRERVLKENENLRVDFSDKWNIATTLISTHIPSGVRGFRRMIGDSQESKDEENFFGNSQYINIKNNYFLDCSYENALEICSDEYTDKYPYTGCVNLQGEDVKFNYRLAYDLSYIKAERILFYVADIYHIARPIIFSPYSRRAVKIQIPNQDQYARVADFFNDNPETLVPYCLEQNQLDGKLLSGKQLMWNIRTESVSLPEYEIANDQNRSYFAPYGDLEIYRYEFKNIDDNAFVCPDISDFAKIIAAEKDLDQRQITLIAKERLLEPCELVQIIRSDSKNIYDFPVFSNLTSDSRFSKERLRTEGDLEFVLHKLSMPEHGFICQFYRLNLTEKSDLKIVLRYSHELTYGESYTPRDQYLYGKRHALTFCYIKFSGDEKFLTDYANYVLFFLENRYPDFRWAGVI